ncbi:MAG: hypothetical protein ACM3O4_05715 [Ignavibacteriales bacterium]
MKKIIFLSFIVIISILGLFVIFSEDNRGRTLERNNDTNVKTVVYKISKNFDILYNQPKDLYNQSQLVVIGNFLNDENTEMTDDSTFITNTTFKIENVLKGNVEDENIKVSYLGGVISVKDYSKNISIEVLKAQGLEKYINDEDKYVEFEFYEAPVNIEKGKDNDKYLLFLSYDKEKKIYQPYSNGYGILKIINGNSVFNKITQEYEEIKF